MNGREPIFWKFLKKKKCEVTNYRPVSLTCIACKLLVSAVKDKIMDHFLSNKLFKLNCLFFY